MQTKQRKAFWPERRRRLLRAHRFGRALSTADEAAPRARRYAPWGRA